MVDIDQVVILNGGTTTTEMACQLSTMVVTHSPTIAVELVNHLGTEVIIGVRLFKHFIVTVGMAAMEALSHIRADVYFMGDRHACDCWFEYR